MKVSNRQEVVLSIHDPALAIGALALWAMSITTRVVRDAFMVTGSAFVEVPAEGSGSAFSDGVEHAELLSVRVMLCDKTLTMQTHHIGQLESRLDESSGAHDYTRLYKLSSGLWAREGLTCAMCR